MENFIIQRLADIKDNILKDTELLNEYPFTRCQDGFFSGLTIDGAKKIGNNKGKPSKGEKQ